MKELLSLLALAALLTGCTPLSPSPHGDVPKSDTVTMSTQFPVYDKDIDRIQVIIENGGETNLNYGVEWAMEVQQGGSWKQIPYAEGYAWIQPLISLMPAGTYSYYVSMDMLDYDLKDGTYRVVKEISGEVYTAEFMIGESTVSADSPFGYVPLEDLPAVYTRENAAADGVVLMHPDGTFENSDRMETFLKDYIRGVDTQIRFAHYEPGNENELSLTDVTVDRRLGSTRIRHTYDCTRVICYNPYSYTHYLRYITVDDFGRFWLSNTLETAEHSENSELLYEISEFFGKYSDWADTVREYTLSTYNGIGAWSPDGLRLVESSRDDVLHFYVNIRHAEGGEIGYTANLLDVKPAERIIDVVWQDNTVAVLVCSNQIEGVQYYGGDDTYTYCFYDTESEELLRTVVSAEEYRFDENRNLIIPQ
ncbi:MAG: hypothetical protein E7631_01155 [Ruminococcaceae bacterium]|nr:hypothetical protein [Oscillospiraceae bacterium]